METLLQRIKRIIGELTNEDLQNDLKELFEDKDYKEMLNVVVKAFGFEDTKQDEILLNYIYADVRTIETE